MENLQKTDWSSQDQPVFCFHSTPVKKTPDSSAFHTGRIQKKSPPQQLIKLTRAVRRQIYTQDLIMALILTREADKTKPIPKKTAQVIQRLKDQMNEINHILYGGDRTAFVDHLSDKDRTRYTATMLRFGDVLDTAFENDKVDVDFYEAVLMVVDDSAVAVQQSKNAKLKACWNRVRGSIVTLYNHMTEDVPAQSQRFPIDHDWIGYKYMRLGKALGQRIEDVIAA